MLKKFRAKIKANITKAANNVKKEIKKIKNGATQLIKSTAKKITKFYSNSVFLPLLPMLGAMKHLLKKKGISTKGMDLKDIVQAFHNNVVIKHKSFDNLQELNYENFESLVAHSLINDLENFESVEDATTAKTGEVLATTATATENKEFDKAGLLGGAGGAAAGMAIGLPPQAGAAIGGSLEKIIKAIVAFFKKGKDDKNKEVVDALGVETSEEDVNEATKDMDGSGEKTESKHSLNNLFIALGAFIILVVSFKKLA